MAFLFKKTNQMKPTRPTESQITRAVNSCLTIDLPDGELDDIIAEIEEFCENSYKEGMEEGNDEGYQNGKREAFDDENAVEKINTEFVVDKFKDVENFDQFIEIFNEIRNRSYNFM